MAEEISLSALVARFGGRLAGPERAISGIAPLSLAGPGELSFLADARLHGEAEKTRAGALLVREDFTPREGGKTYWLCPDPYLYFARVSRFFHPRRKSRGTVHPTAVIDPASHIGSNVEMEANVVVGAGVTIGAGSIIMVGSILGAGVTLGENALIHPGVKILEGSKIGNDVEIHSGSVIGSDGFGNAWNGEAWEKIPQVGAVEIHDQVEIGANVTIDRGAMENTVIEEGVKIDNLVQIAHNCKIGAHTAIAAMVGMAGGTVIGKNCLIGGSAKFAGHLTVADGVVVAAAANISRSLPQQNGHYAGFYPFQEWGEWRKNVIYIRHLREMAEKIKKLEKLVKLTEKES